MACMNLESRLRKTLILVLTVFGAIPVLAAPARLRLSVERPTLEIAESTALHIEFLDDDYKPAMNDRDRTIYFETRSAGPRETGAGDVAPSRVRAAPRGTATTVFTAQYRGRLLVRAISDGLAPAQALITIVTDSTSSLLTPLLPTVRADDPESLFQIFPSDQEVPLNGVSPATFNVAVGRKVEQGGVLRVRITTEPQVSVVYAGRRRTGYAEFELPEGESQSDQIDVFSPHAGIVNVSARLIEARPPIGGGQDSTGAARFCLAIPRRILIDHARSLAAYAELSVSLADQDGNAIGTLDRTHRILLTSPDGVTLEPARIALNTEAPTGSSIASAPMFAWGELLVRANDLDNELQESAASIPYRISTVALILSVAFSSLFGAATRHLYRFPVKGMLPTWSRDRLELGLVGNIVFGIGFGLILYQAGQAGILSPLLIGVGMNLENSTLFAIAVVLGVCGGFAGVAVLDRLTERLLPVSKTT